LSTGDVGRFEILLSEPRYYTYHLPTRNNSGLFLVDGWISWMCTVLLLGSRRATDGMSWSH